MRLRLCEIPLVKINMSDGSESPSDDLYKNMNEKIQSASMIHVWRTEKIDFLGTRHSSHSGTLSAYTYGRLKL